MMMGSEHCGDDIFMSSPGSASSSSSPARFIEHRVSRMDTLAGVAIKYGVEIADIKRMNGLVNDLQMFALKTVQIPLPGRHPPSPSLSNDANSSGPSISEKTPPRRRHSDILESFESLKVTPTSKASSAMNSLQGFYGLRPPVPPRRNSTEGFEMAVYSKENSVSTEDGLSQKSASRMNPPLSLQRKCKSLADCSPVEENELGDNNFLLMEPYSDDSSDSDMWSEKPIRRRQKSKADPTSRSPVKLLKENGVGSWFSAIAGKGLALRSKAMSKTNAASEQEPSNGAHTFLSPGGSASAVSNGVPVVRKSSSTPSLQDQESNSVSSLWSGSKWNLKSDFQALSNAAIAKPILDGLSNLKTKTALD